MESDTKFTLAVEDTIVIPIDSISLNYSTYPVYYANDTIEFYITANEHINGIDFYNLKSKRLEKRNVFDREGPDGILSTRKIYVHSLDSIYIYSDRNLKILLVNYEGQVISHYKVEQQWMANLLQPFIIIENYAFFAFMNIGDNRDQTGQSTLRMQNLNSEITQQFGPKYPGVFEKNLYYNFLPYYCYGHNKNFVFRFGSLPQIYNYDIVNDSVSIFQMKSSYQVDPILPDKNANEFRDMNKSFEEIEQDSYLGIYYDKYNHVYYSIFRKGVPILDLNGDKNQLSDKPISIIIFNENFEYSGETLLKTHTYFNNFICTKKGLLIPTSHPKNPDNDEKKLQFHLFNLEQVY